MSGNFSLSGRTRHRLVLVAVILGVGAASFPAQAVPSFARQTNQECTTCHIGAFGPQLTSYGIRFKLGGYTETNTRDSLLPLSGMLRVGRTHTAIDNAAPPRHYGANNNTTIEEASVFLAGRLSSHVGSFTQMTWDGITRRWGMDNMDVRYARELKIGERDINFGVSFNNRPTVQDPFNTTTIWRFPFNSAPGDLAAGPAAAPVIDGALDGRVFGLTAYAQSDGKIYAEIGGYRAADRGYMINTNAISDPSSPGDKLVGTAPYGRLAYLDMYGRGMVSAGFFGMSGKLRPFDSAGPGDKFSDLGIDASYQYLGTREHIFTAAGSYIREKRSLDETFGAGGAQNPSVALNQSRLTASYHYRNTYGITVSRFATAGSADGILYANGKPDSRGWVTQLDWTPLGKGESWGAPWANLRVGLQFTRYGKFDGVAEGAGDNNNTNLFVWTTF